MCYTWLLKPDMKYCIAEHTYAASSQLGTSRGLALCIGLLLVAECGRRAVQQRGCRHEPMLSAGFGPNPLVPVVLQLRSEIGS